MKGSVSHNQLSSFAQSKDEEGQLQQTYSSGSVTFPRIGGGSGGGGSGSRLGMKQSRSQASFGKLYRFER